MKNPNYVWEANIRPIKNQLGLTNTPNNDREANVRPVKDGLQESPSKLPSRQAMAALSHAVRSLYGPGMRRRRLAADCFIFHERLPKSAIAVHLGGHAIVGTT